MSEVESEIGDLDVEFVSNADSENEWLFNFNSLILRDIWRSSFYMTLFDVKKKQGFIKAPATPNTFWIGVMMLLTGLTVFFMPSLWDNDELRYIFVLLWGAIRAVVTYMAPQTHQLFVNAENDSRNSENPGESVTSMKKTILCITNVLYNMIPTSEQAILATIAAFGPMGYHMLAEAEFQTIGQVLFTGWAAIVVGIMPIDILGGDRESIIATVVLVFATLSSLFIGPFLQQVQTSLVRLKDDDGNYFD